MAASKRTAKGYAFTHLHLHSQYSLLDGANRVEDLCARVKELGMHSVAVTDHGNLFGAAHFYKAAKAEGIKPILGIEAYVAPGDRTDKTHTGVADGGYHLVLLAENLTGWNNLLKLSSDAFINGFYYKPRMDKATLEQWADGVIAINGHLGSSLAALLVRYEQSKHESDYEKAVEEARWHAETFGVNEEGQPRFYIELQRHIPEQEAINPHLIRLARELGLPLVCDNDSHFLLADDHDPHDTLVCISTGKLKADEQRMKYPTQLYVKSPQEMWELFDGYEGDAGREALENTERIAERCDVEIDFSQNHAPVVKVRRKVEAAGSPASAGVSDAGGVSDAALGSTEWFKDFCAQYELLPYNSETDTDSAEQLNEQCDIALRELCEAGMIWRYGPEEEGRQTADHRARLDRELKILGDKNIAAYFLIVWDFVNEARQRGIPCNARGSGVGTMVGYVLGLSNACPVEYGRLFERFTDPDRSEYPDIDIDMCQDGRAEVIEYVREKYGHVAQIITFNVLKARAAIRDVGRVLNVPLPQVDEVCKLIGDGLGTTLDKALDSEPDLKKLYADSAIHKDLLDTARRLEGLTRHAGVHAAGVIVATQPLDTIVPLYQPPGTEMTVTQWDGPTCEKVGLLKMDFLGLRTLSIVERAKELVKQGLDDETIRAAVGQGQGQGHAHLSEHADRVAEDPPERVTEDPLDLERLQYDDQQVLDLFRRGETAGVFQFESGGMRNLLMAMKPDRLGDLIAANALYRPGPMDLIPDYCARKHGKQEVPKVHEIVDRFTAETNGIMVYQEQVMQIVHELGGIPLRQAYTLIKAISKKKVDVIDSNRAKFIQGAGEHGLGKDKAAELFDLILKFAGYGFNKSHSTGYAIVAYQTAYLKTYFPLQYMAALLTYESVSTDKVVEYIDECKRVMLPSGQRGITVRPPDINRSDVAFTVVFEPGEKHDANHGHIRFGLSAVKGVGEKAINCIIAERVKEGPFKSLFDFCERVPLGSVNRATIEALIKCGAFDSVHGEENRASMVATLDAALSSGQRVAADRDSGQLNFFMGGAAEADGQADKTPEPETTLTAVPPWPKKEQLEQEKSVLGLYASSHPLDDVKDALERFGNTTVADIKGLAADVEVTLGGMLTRVRPTLTRAKQQKMAILTLEDSTGPIDAVVFPRTYALVQELLELDQIVFLKGKVDRRREEPNIVVDDVIPLSEAPRRLTKAVCIRLQPRMFPPRGEANGQLKQLKQLLRTVQPREGDAAAEVYFDVRQEGRRAKVRINVLRVGVSPDLDHRVATVLGVDDPTLCCALYGPKKLKVDTVEPSLRHNADEAGDMAGFSMRDDGGLSIDRLDN